MARKDENQHFVCQNCGEQVEPLTNGSYRNHCPVCLYSKHVDERPGDRMSDCGGLMQPVRLEHKRGKGLQIIHRCLKCGKEQANKIAVDTVQPDDVDALARLSQ